jgi:hypothetical protein
MTQEELERRATEVGLLYDLSYMGEEWNPAAGIFGADDVKRFLIVSDTDGGDDQYINFCATADQVAGYFKHLLYDEFGLWEVHDLESDDYLTPLPIDVRIDVRGLSRENTP